MFASKPTRKRFVNHSLGLYSTVEPMKNRSAYVWLSYVFAISGVIVEYSGPAGNAYVRPGTASYELMIKPAATLSLSGSRRWLWVKPTFDENVSLFVGTNEKLPRSVFWSE